MPLLTVDKAGRVVLPKPVRDKLQLNAGDALELESSEGQIVLRPIRGTARMRMRDGIWVFRTGGPVSASSVNETIQQMRHERTESVIHPQQKTRAARRKSR